MGNTRFAGGGVNSLLQQDMMAVREMKRQELPIRPFIAGSRLRKPHLSQSPRPPDRLRPASQPPVAAQRRTRPPLPIPPQAPGRPS